MISAAFSKLAHEKTHSVEKPLHRIQKAWARIGAAVVIGSAVMNGAVASTQVTESLGSVNNLAISGNDLFWAETEAEPDGTYVKARICRTDKNRTLAPCMPILEETNTEKTATFDALTVANVGGIRYVYFVVNRSVSSTRKVSYINRVRAEGGAVEGIANPLPMGMNDLKSDGTYLYWADREKIRKVPMAGGSPTILASVENLPYVKQVAVDENYVYYNRGPNGDMIYRVPKAGGAERIQAIATSTVTDIFVRQTNGQTTLYWSEMNGAVRSLELGKSEVVNYQEPMPDRKATSVAFDGTRVLWANCPSTLSGESCRIHEFQNGAHLVLNAGDAGNWDARDIVVEPDRLYWRQSRDVSRYVHPEPLRAVINPSPVFKEGSRKAGVNGITETVQAMVTGGEPDGIDTVRYRFEWTIDNGFFTIHHWRAQRTSIFAAMPDNDSREGTLTLKVTDRLGRTVTSETPIRFWNPPNDDGTSPQ